MLEIKTKLIDDIEFQYQPMFATPARELLDELIQRFGPIVAAGVEGLGDASSIQDINLDTDLGVIFAALGDSLGGAIRVFCGAMDPAFHKKLVDKLGPLSSYKNSDTKNEFIGLVEANREHLFATQLWTETKWVAFCLEVQFADFFALARTGAASALIQQFRVKGSNSGFQKA